jgi:ribulose-5-phosphate 4-epimerase/fuculose-1-phosphate aldolase
MMTELELRDAVVRAGRHLAAAGLSPGSSGNISVRLEDGSILSTPTGSAMRSLEPDDLTIADAPGANPTKELPLHRAMYEERPDAAAVVHLHSPHATAIACLPPGPDGFAALPALTPYRVMRLGSVPLAPYAPPGTTDLAAGVRAFAAEHAVILLANHGPVVAAPSLDAAIDLVEELETAAQLSLLLRQTPAVTLDDAAIAALRARSPQPPGH